ncbi:MAG: DUF4910 domain-containing protein [Bacteroidetes bacterium]|nr:DUF4910 domain-containing protein [Bacteroidota bacterium]
MLNYGALAVVCYLDDVRAMEYPDMLAYTGMWPKSHELERTTFGFNLTRRQGQKLRGMLEAGTRVVVQGRVEGIGLEPYFMDLPVAVIRGSVRPEEELIFSAHLDHPKESANDNASGSAALLDIATTLRRLIDSGRLPQPRRTLRFIWVPEWYGTMAYIDAHPEMSGPDLGGRVLANVNMDMVGENLEILHSRMNITRTPDSIPSVFDDVVANMAEMVDGMDIRTPRGSLSTFNYRMTAYSGGSDHMMFIDRKVPGIMIGHGPDYTHHTSEDTPDKVDPVELERSEIIGTGALWYLANLEPDEAGELIHIATRAAFDRLSRAAHQADTMIAEADLQELPVTWFEAQNLLSLQALHAAKEISSVLNFADAPELRQMVDRFHGVVTVQFEAYTEQLKAYVTERAGQEIEGRTPYTEVDDRVPVRLTRGPLDFGLPESRLDSESAAWYSANGRALSGNVRFEMANFIDGERTVTDIRNLVSAEFGPIPQDAIAHILQDLVSVGVLSWAE